MSDTLNDPNGGTNGTDGAVLPKLPYKFTATVKQIDYFIEGKEEDSDAKRTITLTFDKTFIGIEKDANGNYVDSDKCNSISIDAKALTAQLCNLNDDVALFKGVNGNRFSRGQFVVVLFKATLTVARTYVAATQVYQAFDGTDKVAEHNVWFNEIKAVTLSAKAVAKIDKATDLPDLQ